MEFWLDEKIGSLPPEARLLYIGTWSIADDNGVLRGNPAYIRSQLFAYDEEVTAADVRRWIELLTAERMLVPFTHRGERYLLVRRFRDHQKIDARYATELIPFAEVEAALAEAEAANTLTDNAPREPHVNPACAPCEPHVKHVLGVGVGDGVETHTPVCTEKGGVGENTTTVASEVAVADDVRPVGAAEDDDDDDWYGVVEVSPATSAATPADVFAQRAAQIRGLIGERYPHIAAMHEPLRDDQLLWIARRYAMEDVRRILSDMDDKRVYDPHSRSYRTKTFNAFMAFADCDRMVGRGGAGRRADSAGGMPALRPSKRLYTYEEMCDEIPSRARQEDFTMVEVGGRKLWQKRVVV